MKYTILPYLGCVTKILFVREAPSKKDGAFFYEIRWWFMNVKREKPERGMNHQISIPECNEV